MSLLLNVFVDDETARFLKKQAKELDRKIEDLAECAIAEYCLHLMKKRPTGKLRRITNSEIKAAAGRPVLATSIINSEPQKFVAPPPINRRTDT